VLWIGWSFVLANSHQMSIFRSLVTNRWDNRIVIQNPMCAADIDNRNIDLKLYFTAKSRGLQPAESQVHSSKATIHSYRPAVSDGDPMPCGHFFRQVFGRLYLYLIPNIVRRVTNREVD